MASPQKLGGFFACQKPNGFWGHEKNGKNPLDEGRQKYTRGYQRRPARPNQVWFGVTVRAGVMRR